MLSFSTKNFDNAVKKEMRKYGYDDPQKELDDKNRVAKMIILYGYIFTDSVEELIDRKTEKELLEIERIVDELIDIINEKLSRSLVKVDQNKRGRQ